MRNELDSQDMEGIIRQSPLQLQAGIAAAKGVVIRKRSFKRVLIAGMGGSWMAGALARDFGLATAPIRIHRGYGIPTGLNPRTTLVIASSFSGNTEEVLSTFDAALAEGFSLVGVAKGGELKKRCAKNGVAFVRIPADPPKMQPRSATGHSFGIIAALLAGHGLAPRGSLRKVKMLEDFLTQFMDTARSRGRGLVPALAQATPVFYASSPYATVARICKIKINENAKAPAFWNVFPELNHNEMTGWIHRRGPFHLVLLRDPADDPRVLRRFDVTREMLGHYGVSSSVVPMEGDTVLEKAFSTLLVGDWASYELALASGVDPSPVEMVEDLKERLSG